MLSILAHKAITIDDTYDCRKILTIVIRDFYKKKKEIYIFRRSCKKLISLIGG